MPDNTGNTNSESGNDGSASTEITPELVNQVADQVWQMWKRDLRIERERFKPHKHRFIRQGGH
jgi:hypothetical protein